MISRPCARTGVCSDADLRQLSAAEDRSLIIIGVVDLLLARLNRNKLAISIILVNVECFALLT